MNNQHIMASLMACVVAAVTALMVAHGHVWMALAGAFIEGCILTQHLYITTVVNPLMKSATAMLKSYEGLLDALRKIGDGAK